MDSGVDVFLSVAVAVKVGTDAVRVEAALAVCTINVLTALGSSVGTGVAMDGTHAMTNTKIVNQSNSFFPGERMFIHSCRA